jgi:hypothetical protein
MCVLLLWSWIGVQMLQCIIVAMQHLPWGQFIWACCMVRLTVAVAIATAGEGVGVAACEEVMSNDIALRCCKYVVLFFVG